MAHQSEWQYRRFEDPFNERLNANELYVESNEASTIQTDLGERDNNGELVIQQTDRWYVNLHVRAYALDVMTRTNTSSVRFELRSDIRFDQERPRQAKWRFVVRSELPQEGYATIDGGFPGGEKGFISQLMESQTVVVRFRRDVRNLPRANERMEQTHTLTFPTAGLAEALAEHGFQTPSRPNALMKLGFKKIALIGLGGFVLVIACGIAAGGC